MRLAAIDIGTNTVLLLVADVDENGVIHPIKHLQRFPRLGKDVGRQGIIHPSAFERIAQVVSEYNNLSKQLGAEKVIACATSAVRDSANKKEFITYIKTTSGLDVEVLSGENEALWSYRGAISGFPSLDKKAVVLDIGGGSTEITYFLPNKKNSKPLFQCHSLQIGSVRLSERYFKHDPPSESELQSAIQAIMQEFSRVSFPELASFQLVGVAGTVTTLACLELKLMEFDIEKVSGFKMSRDTVGIWTRKLSSLQSNEIRTLSNTTEGREDILTAGVLILNEFMKHFGFESVVVSERGLRYGLVIYEWEQQLKRLRRLCGKGFSQFQHSFF